MVGRICPFVIKNKLKIKTTTTKKGGKKEEEERTRVVFSNSPFSKPSPSQRSATHNSTVIVQELCESRDGRPGLIVLTSLVVSVDV